jgi:hypothetical protein
VNVSAILGPTPTIAAIVHPSIHGFELDDMTNDRFLCFPRDSIMSQRKQG